MQEKRNKTEEEQGGIGRSNFIEEQQTNEELLDKVSNSDISNIDQYEGHMEHGNLGGNFNDPQIKISKGNEER